jgi:hypothetical protein
MAQRKFKGGKSVSLWQAVNWIVFQDFTKSIAPSLRDQKYEQAQWEIFEALRGGSLIARGHYIFSPLEPAVGESIGSEVWWPDRILWDSNILYLIEPGPHYSEVDGKVVNYYGVRYERITLERNLIMKRWPKRAATIENINGPKAATVGAIKRAISQVYDDADAAGEKPPNVVKVIRPVQNLLARSGHTASGAQIQLIAGEPEYAQRRRKPGRTVFSEKKKDKS